MTKIDNLILQIIDDQPVSSQSQLLECLSATGKNITQSTLSRKLRNLNIIKSNGVYVEASNRKHGIKHLINVAVSPPNILVIHTSPGYASSIAARIDLLVGRIGTNKNSTSAILGTIAGDDTIMVISDGKTDLQRLKSQIILHLQ